MRRIGIIILIVLSVVIIVSFGYLLSKNSPVEPGDSAGGSLPQALPPGNNLGANNQGQLPGVQDGKKEIVFPGEVSSFYASTTGILAVVRNDGAIFKNNGSSFEALFDGTVDSLSESSFSATGKYVLASYREGNNFRFSIFDTTNSSWQPLPTEVLSAAWSPKGDSLAYLVQNNNSGDLVTIDVANKKAKPAMVGEFSTYGLSLSWPGENSIVISEKPDSSVLGSAWMVNPKTKKVFVLTKDVLGLWGLWNKDASRGLTWGSNQTGRGGKLSLREGSMSKNFDFLSLPSKCVFVEKTTLDKNSTSTKPKETITESIFCGIPSDDVGLRNKNIPNDHLNRSLYTKDDIYEIDIQSGVVLPLYISKEGEILDVSSLRVIDKYLYFINRLDSSLIKIEV